MLGTIVNTCTILSGSVLGSLLRKGVKEKYQNALYTAMGLAATGLGINAVVTNMAKSHYPVLFIVSLAIGSLIGTILDIDGRFQGLVGRYSKSNLGQGLSTGILLYCIGSLSILGPVMSALHGDNTYLFTNATLDFVTSTVLASTYGIGMAFAAPVLFCWQGAIFLIASYLSGGFFSEEMIAELCVVGGFLIASSGLGILKIKDCKTLNMLPALVIPILFFLVKGMPVFAEEIQIPNQMIAAAQQEGTLLIYGSGDEESLEAFCDEFAELYGIEVDYECFSDAEAYERIKNSAGKPEADVWFGSTLDSYKQAGNDGLLESCEVENIGESAPGEYSDPDHQWYSLYQGVIGFVVNLEELDRLDLDPPAAWEDLIKEEYAGLIIMPNPDTSDTGKKIVNTLVELKDHDAAMDYFELLNENVVWYTEKGADAVSMAATGEGVIGVGCLSNRISQNAQEYEDLELIIPKEGTSYEVGGTAILKGCAHPEAAKLWTEYILRTEYKAVKKENTEWNSDQITAVNTDYENTELKAQQNITDYFARLGDIEDDERFLDE